MSFDRPDKPNSKMNEHSDSMNRGNGYNRDDSPKRKRRRITKPRGEVRKITQERPPKEQQESELRLNKYISNCGVCSRREADVLIQDGKVKVNGEVVTTMGFKVLSTDVVEVNGQEISTSPKVYILLNKPKDYITTTNDPQGRRTVMELVEEVDSDRVYPVGRLDRNTTGILLFTNDGELSQRLMHPKSNIAKIYSVELSEPLSMPHYYKLQKGISLFDGFMKPDKVAFVNQDDRRKIGVQIHSGRNRVVRRMFEALGYEVVKLDRVIYAGLDKAGLSRGKWRNLTEKEVHQIKRAARMR